ncbi:MAG TPA: hypothetical protein VK742_13840 [Candidatus Sulfotelmatobacter sp.]|jgi:hypothetical protein|nr:hypothetical protein [Candidatus Sulfotelmatobacter sp.]
MKQLLSSIALAFALAGFVHAETVSIVIATNAAPRVEFGAEKIAEALKSAGYESRMVHQTGAGKEIVITNSGGPGKEGFLIAGDSGALGISGGDDSGAFYGCLELAKRIRESNKFPDEIHFTDAPAMRLRGTCVAMQKTFILPGRKVYEYPYTPELFPWFYDKKLWTEYLDFLAANRMNTLYLWSGHPFASLVRLKDYPYAVEVPDDVFQQNQEQFRWLAQECDKRGIWLVQMFYNIIVSKPFAETNGISTQLSAPTPLTEDYTRKSIAEFVKQYPNVGLMVCLGEALQGTANQLEWCTNVILPGVLDGMHAANLKEEPPVVIRTHAMDPYAIMPAAYQVYSNIFTESKYNGESLTTWEPRGKDAAIQVAMAKLGPHLANIHILSNLEPFRYGDTEFIRKSVIASRDRLGATGIHLYPLSYWNWPYSPDIAAAPLLQWNRDWIWYEAWARYSWNPDVNTNEDRAYWISRLADFYGDTNAAEKILDAYNAAGEVAPRLIRRFGITEGNRQTLSLGMTLDQLVKPNKYGAIDDLWLSQAPPGERLDEYVSKEWNHQSHEGETPETIIADVLEESSNAVALAASIPSVPKNNDELKHLQNDTRCIQAMAENYSDKVRTAELVLRYNYSHDISDMDRAAQYLADSFAAYQKLVTLTHDTYHYANSMQTSQRKIPVPGGKAGKPANYLWSQLVPLYQKELEDFQTKVSQLKQNTNVVVNVDESQIEPWPSAAFKLISTNAETYKIETGAKVFTDRAYTIQHLARQLDGLTGIRFSHAQAKDGLPPLEFEVNEPVLVLVGYFDSNKKAWLQVPKLEFAAQADDRGGVDVLLENAATISECPNVNLHAFRFDAGRQKLELIGNGSFVVLGIVPQSAKLK